MLENSEIPKRSESLSDIVIRRRVKVNRCKPPRDVLRDTGRRLYTNDEVVATMPRGEGDEVEVILFLPELWEYTRPGYMSNEDIEKCFERRGLKSADPYSVSAMNRDDTALADEYPHGIQWKDTRGYWCFAWFDCYHGNRDMLVGCDCHGWHDRRWYAGLHK
jgi:hypothetical protein